MLLKSFILPVAALFILMVVFWCYYLYKNNPGVIDLGWVLGLFLCGNLYLLRNGITHYTLFYSALLFLWALRLGWYLYFTRIKPNIIEKRYVKISADWNVKKSLGFFLNFQFQGILIIFIALPFLFIGSNYAHAITFIDVLIALLVLIGIMGEAIADYQLHNFLQKHKGKLCNVGLWNYSRHPNYFFEWLVWLGFALAALQAKDGQMGFVSPLLLITIMVFITGPITEKSSLESKGDTYREYQKTTSMFFPWFKK